MPYTNNNRLTWKAGVPINVYLSKGILKSFQSMINDDHTNIYRKYVLIYMSNIVITSYYLSLKSGP